MAHGFLTSNSRNNSRQTDQALRINLCLQCPHVRHRLCFSSRSNSPRCGNVISHQHQHCGHHSFTQVNNTPITSSYLWSHQRATKEKRCLSTPSTSAIPVAPRELRLVLDTSYQIQLNNCLAESSLTAGVAKKPMEGSRSLKAECPWCPHWPLM